MLFATLTVPDTTHLLAQPAAVQAVVEALVVQVIAMIFMSAFFNARQIVARRHVLIMVQSLGKISFMTFIPVGRTILVNILTVMRVMRNTVHV